MADIMTSARKQNVSVIIPCHNAARFLREAIDSALAQTHPPLEIIVIDDGSTDDSAHIAQSYGPPVRVIRQENSGPSIARNRGIDEAQGEWIAFLDADDVWDARKLELQLRLADEDVACVHTDYYTWGWRPEVRRFSRIPEEERYQIDNMVLLNPFFTSTLLVRRSVSPRYPTWTDIGEDWIYTIELAQRGVVKMVPEALVGYRRHDTSLTRSDPAVMIRRHRTRERWLQHHAHELRPETVTLLRSTFVRRCAKAAGWAKARRDWPAYWKIRRHLEQFCEYPEARHLIKERIYPTWAYAVKDAFAAAKRAVARIHTART